MNINHINLSSCDIASDCAMFEAFFGLRCLHIQGDQLAILEDDGDMWLVLNKFGEADDFAYLANFLKHHIDVIQPNREDVDLIHVRLKEESWKAQEPREFHGA